MNDRPIFPEIRTKVTAISCSAETMLRIKHTDGRYYLRAFYRSRFDVKGVNPAEIATIIKQMVWDVYLELSIGVVVPDLVLIDGTRVFVFDDNQQEESDRLRSLLSN